MENKEIVAVEQAALPKEKLLEFLNIAGVATKLTEKERVNFVEIAQAYCLNPFKREIYCVSYGYGDNKTTSIITGYEVYIKRAERTGKLDGWEVTIEGNLPDLKAVITIYRNDWSRPFKHEVYFEEVVQRKKDGSVNAMWSKMPKFMLRKVAIAQGFRFCFSDELGGIPYTADELPSEEKPQAETVQAAPVLSEEDKNTVLNSESEKDLVKNCQKMMQKNSAFKKELTALYNKRLKELLKAEKETGAVLADKELSEEVNYGD